MLRKPLAARHIGGEKEFRWRGGEVSRVEGFSDAVFAFAITLLVVSLEVPRSFNELLSAMRGLLAFGICFLLLFQVWFYHYTFFRRYGLYDTWTTWLNAVLLFVVLFYVYPLKFVFTLLANEILGVSVTVTLANGQSQPMLEPGQGPQLFLVFGIGWIAVNLIFTLLYGHAYRLRGALALNTLEVEATRSSIERLLLGSAIGMLSIGIALFIGSEAAATWSGLVYCLIPVVLTVHGFWRGGRIRQLAAEAQATGHDV